MARSLFWRGISARVWRDENPAERVKASDADDQSADPESAGGAEVAQEGAGAAAEPAEAWGLHARLYDDPEEAELGAAQGRQGASHQRLRGDRLHPGRGPQPPGTLGCHDPRRPREGPARRA